MNGEFLIVNGRFAQEFMLQFRIWGKNGRFAPTYPTNKKLQQQKMPTLQFYSCRGSILHPHQTTDTPYFLQYHLHHNPDTPCFLKNSPYQGTDTPYILKIKPYQIPDTIYLSKNSPYQFTDAF